MKTRCLFWLIPLAPVGLVVLLSLAGNHTPVEAIIEVLPLGWWRFLERNGPQVTWNWSPIGSGVVFSVLIMFLGQWLLKAAFEYVQISLGRVPVRPWRWRWTIAGYAVVWLFFSIALGSSGVIEHARWLMQYDGPWYQPRGFDNIVLHSDGLIVFEIIDENGGSLPATRKAYLSARAYAYNGGNRLLADDCDVVFYGSRSNTVAACLIIPRNLAAGMPGASFGVSGSDGQFTFLPASQLLETVSNLNIKYPQD